MGLARTHELITVDEYLAGEQDTPVKHEFLGGVVYAMAGATIAHNAISSNVLGNLHAQLRGKRCRPFNSDMKIRVRMASQTSFYYPDVSVVCRSNPPDELYQDEPVILVEVLSESSRRIDEVEKKEAYLTIPSLAVYVLFEQDSHAAITYRRTPTGFVRETCAGLEQSISLPEIGANLLLADAYEGVQLAALEGGH